MRKLLLFFLLLLPTIALGQDNGNEKGPVGVGAVIGNPVAINGKFWIDKRDAVDASFSILSKDDIYLQVSYLLHDYTLLQKPEEGELPLYYGVGLVDDADDIGVRSVVGVSYIFNKDYPFDVFIELAPLVITAPDFDVRLTGGIGAHFYWGGEQQQAQTGTAAKQP